MKKRRKPKRNDRRQIVRELAAGGASSDLIAAVLKVGRDRLRSEHTLDLHAGRESKRVAEAAARAAEPTKQEAARLARIKQSFESDWYSPETGNDLYGGARTVEEALQWCQRFKSGRVTNEEISDGI